MDKPCSPQCNLHPGRHRSFLTASQLHHALEKCRKDQDKEHPDAFYLEAELSGVVWGGRVSLLGTPWVCQGEGIPGFVQAHRKECLL